MESEDLPDGSIGLTMPSGRTVQVDDELPGVVFVRLADHEVAELRAGGPPGVVLRARDVVVLAHWLRTKRGVVYP